MCNIDEELCILLYFTVLYYTILYYIIGYWVIPPYTSSILCHFILYHTGAPINPMVSLWNQPEPRAEDTAFAVILWETIRSSGRGLMPVLPIHVGASRVTQIMGPYSWYGFITSKYLGLPPCLFCLSLYLSLSLSLSLSVSLLLSSLSSLSLSLSLSLSIMYRYI